MGTTSIKMVEAGSPRRRNSQPEIFNYGILETPTALERFNTAIQTSTLNLFEEEAIRYLKILREKMGTRTRHVIASLPSFSAFTTVLEMPLMAEEELKKAIGFNVKQYLPMPLAATTLDWLRVGERTDQEGNTKQLLFLISVPTAHIEVYQRIFQGAGLQLLAVEIEGLSLARVLTAGTSDPTLIIDIGSYSTALLVAQDGVLQFSVQTDIAGASLTQSLAAGMDILPRRAEALKKQRGLSMLEAGAERELSTQLVPLLDVILQEAKRARDKYEVNCRTAVKNVILSGGGANLLGLEQYTASRLDLPTTRADPFHHFTYTGSLEALRRELGPPLAVALGLALKGV